jgi:DNA topoisomerase-1
MESTDDETQQEEKEGILPPMKTNDKLDLNEAIAVERFTYPPSRYTEAALVKKLEELGIGRPSTFAPTISTVQKRGYVLKEERMGKERSYVVIKLKDSKIIHEKKTEITGAEKNKLFPTDIGMIVTDFLVANFKDILDYNFTAFVEKEFDDIANGELKWQKMIKEFYGPFHSTVEITEKESVRVSGERILGKDPVSGLTLLVRVGRFGPMAQIGAQDETDKPRFAKLRSDQRLDQIKFEEAMDLFKLPRILGKFEDHDVVVAIGRFGPYVRLNDYFVSMKKEDDPYTITYDRAIELIQDKRKADAEKIIKTFDEDAEVKVLKGRWGPYISYKDRNLRIPKDKDPITFTLQEIHELAEKTPGTPKKKAAFKKSFAVKKPSPAKKETTTVKAGSVKKAAAVKKSVTVKKAPAVKKAVTVKKAPPVKKAVKVKK